MGFDCISFLNIAFLFTFHYLLNLLTLNPFVTSGLKNKTHHLKSCTRGHRDMFEQSTQNSYRIHLRCIGTSSCFSAHFTISRSGEDYLLLSVCFPGE